LIDYSPIRLCRDEDNLEENERIKKELNPRKIDEPKTPYLSPQATEDEDEMLGMIFNLFINLFSNHFTALFSLILHVLQKTESPLYL
jgi:hypothetical protein